MSTKSPKLDGIGADDFLMKLLLHPETTKHQYDQVCNVFSELGFVDGDVSAAGPFMKLHEPMVSAKTVDCLCKVVDDVEEDVIGMHIVKENTGESVWVIYSSDWVGVPMVLASYASAKDLTCCSDVDQEKRYQCHQIYTDSETFEVFEGLEANDAVPIQGYQIVADFLADIMGEDIDWENWGDS